MAVASEGIPLGTEAPEFDLEISNPWVDGQDGSTRSLSLYSGPLVVIFTCNHCPYAIHIQGALADVAREYMALGVQFVAINSNDAHSYPADSFEKMSERAREIDLPFPYLYDATQQVARAYKAACTPDLFVFDDQHHLIYSGRFDETRPGKGTAHGGDLRRALDTLLSEGIAVNEQLPSIGCSIKWKPGNAPSYA